SIEKDHYGRTVARCKANGKDLSCAMVAAGHAIERYGVLNCQ
ncbi:MAG: thermonuclease family protein, partial [Alphaproteobacteria bacterium]|nr:thermonuclease family protein [Alphaproteobacteria bacterium]